MFIFLGLMELMFHSCSNSSIVRQKCSSIKRSWCLL